MMPICEGGLSLCDKTAVFLGPHESPALCEEHFAELLERVKTYFAKHDYKKEADNFEILNPDVQQVLQPLAREIESKIPKGYGFNLLIFSFGKGGSMFYVSNAERANMIEAMREFIARQEGGTK